MFLGFGPHHPDPAGGRMLGVMDGEPHKALRDEVRSIFGARNIARFDTELDELFEEHMTPHLDGDAFDFADEIAWRAPLMVTCAIMGVPVGDSPMLRDLANGVLTMQESTGDPIADNSRASGARIQILSYFDELAASPAVRRGDNVTARLVSRHDAGRLPYQDLLLNLLSMLVAANETTRLAMSGAMVALAEQPEQLELLRRSPSLTGPAVEEVLRWTSPVLNDCRTAESDTVLAGMPIAAGDVVTAWLPAGNRDPAVFERPDTFDIARPSRANVTLGYGPHYCLGAALARIEIAALLRFLARHVGEVASAGRPTGTHSHSLWGYAHVPTRIASLTGAGR
ncbi:cytochrome P450 [Catellatospora coxensis]|uniref:cytochrome P450 n=1 Tax=Catellatospora coxensis TaxID=310354 RepID=UPI00194546CF|nr:cytochrome P450 [Catellatospora coxensis]